MLETLKIENIAVIEIACIRFCPGFNVLTGETGAGKSIIIDSINAVLGERTSRELVRTGAARAKVTAVFSDVSFLAKRLSDLGIDPSDDGTLIIQRVISSDGKSSCRINGEPVSASMLRGVCGELVNIHGQHDSQSLLSPERHFTYVDKFGGNAKLLDKYKEAYGRRNSLKKELKSLDIDEGEKIKLLDLLYYQINELEAAGVTPGERDELNARRSLMLNAEKVSSALAEAYSALCGGEDFSGASGMCSDAANSLDAASQFAEGLDKSASELRDFSYTIEELGRDLRARMEELVFDGKELADVEERLEVLYRLSRKYGDTEEDMISYLEDAKKRALGIELADERRESLERELADAQKNLESAAAELTFARRTAGDKFSRGVCGELTALDMPDVTFAVSVEPCEPGADGADRVEFLISPNRGEVPKPLSRIASGGELSRVMLAIRNVLSADGDTGTLIFDEIDAGVSGRAAQGVAEKLREVSSGRQVICVTHLAIIAARADSHYRISKSVDAGRTYTQVELLDREGRVREIARINGGRDITQLTLKNAEEMLDSAKL